MESLDYPEFPVHLSVVHVALFTQIIRPSHLRERLINVAKGDQGDTEREAVNFAFINAHLVRLPAPQTFGLLTLEIRLRVGCIFRQPSTMPFWLHPKGVYGRKRFIQKYYGH